MRNKHVLLILAGLLITENAFGSDSYTWTKVPSDCESDTEHDSAGITRGLNNPPSPHFTLPKLLAFAAKKQLDQWPKQEELVPISNMHQPTHLQLSINDDASTVSIKDTRTQHIVGTLPKSEMTGYCTQAFLDADGTIAMIQDNDVVEFGFKRANFTAYEISTRKKVWPIWPLFFGSPDSLKAQFMKDGSIVTTYLKRSGDITRPCVQKHGPMNDTFTNPTPAQQKFLNKIDQHQTPISLWAISSSKFPIMKMRQSLEKEFDDTQREQIVKTYEISDFTTPGWKESTVNCLFNCWQKTARFALPAQKSAEPKACPSDQTMEDKQK